MTSLMYGTDVCSAVGSKCFSRPDTNECKRKKKESKAKSIEKVILLTRNGWIIMSENIYDEINLAYGKAIESWISRFCSIIFFISWWLDDRYCRFIYFLFFFFCSFSPNKSFLVASSLRRLCWPQYRHNKRQQNFFRLWNAFEMIVLTTNRVSIRFANIILPENTQAMFKYQVKLTGNTVTTILAIAILSWFPTNSNFLFFLFFYWTNLTVNKSLYMWLFSSYIHLSTHIHLSYCEIYTFFGAIICLSHFPFYVSIQHWRSETERYIARRSLMFTLRDRNIVSDYCLHILSIAVYCSSISISILHWNAYHGALTRSSSP